MPVFLGGVHLKSSHLLWMCLGLDWLESFSGLSCMYSASCLEARELAAARIRVLPKIPLLLHRLKLTSCVCTLLPLSCPRSACCCLTPGPGLP